MRLRLDVYKESLKLIKPDGVYTIKQTAEFLGVSSTTLYRLRSKNFTNANAPRSRSGSPFYLGSDLMDWMNEVVETDEKGGLSERISRLIESAPKTVKVTGELSLTTGKSTQVLRFGDAV